MPRRLVILRHAQSEWNAQGWWQGQADPGLSAEGRRQASAAAKVLASMGRFGGIFSSDLSRAVQTAAILKDALGTALPLEVEPGLREYDVGGWSGRTREEIESRWPGDIRRFACGELAAPPGGETRAGFDSRILAAAERVAERASSAGADGVLVVAHGGVVMGLARLAGVVEYRVGNLAGYTGRCDAGALFPEEPIDLLELELAAD